ncbi:MAG: T9SS type A sorting domain-containing protein, partial [Elusimicrobia bacterium]|nr:T9SS type A sorting domain-containing protein [Elusimicrobiota bacterium]
KARAVSGDGLFSAFSPVVSTVTLPLLPVRPAAPAGAVLGVSSITWSWAAVGGVSGYRLYYATAPASLIASPSTGTYIHTGLTPNTTYSVVVAGVNPTGTGPVSPAAVPVATLASPPSGAAAAAVYTTSVTLTWGLNGNPAGTTAKVMRVTPAATFTVAANSYTDTGLLSCTSYYYRVWNVNLANVITQYAAVGPVLTASPSPLPPGNFSAESLAGNKISLAWLPSPFEGITGYNLYYDSGTGTIDYGTPLATLAADRTSYTTGVLVSSAAYKFGLRAVHRCGVEEANVTVLATAPSLFSLTGVRAAIKIPQTGKKVSGNSVTVMAELVTGTETETRDILLQYKASASGTWLNIPAKDPANHPNPDADSPYFIHWDVTALAPGSYDLRAVATDLDNAPDASPGAITIIVDPVEADITENSSGGKVIKVQNLNNLVESILQAADSGSSQVTELQIPAGALDYSTGTVTVINDPSGAPGSPEGTEDAGIVAEITLSNQTTLAGGLLAEVTLVFPDADNDGIVDGTLVRCSQLRMYSAHSAAGPWVFDTGSVVDCSEKKVTGHTSHFSFFALFATLSGDLNSAKVYPVPWRPGSGDKFDSAAGTDGIIFTNLTDRTEIRIYTITGQLVRELKLAPADLGRKVWDGKNSAGLKAASGVYLAHIKSGQYVKTMKIAVER